MYCGLGVKAGTAHSIRGWLMLKPVVSLATHERHEQNSIKRYTNVLLKGATPLSLEMNRAVHEERMLLSMAGDSALTVSAGYSKKSINFPHT